MFDIEVFFKWKVIEMFVNVRGTMVRKETGTRELWPFAFCREKFADKNSIEL